MLDRDMIGITSKTRKVLWGRAGARCSFEGCRIELIELSEGESGDAILGKEAHIIAQKKDGARGENPIELQRINLYENLILLCPTHHTLIDAQPRKYTVQVLHQMKKAHESWVDHNLGGRNRAEEFHYLPDPVYARFCYHRLIHLWKYPKAHVLCCSYGSDPVEILSGIWKGSGIEFYRFPGGKVVKAPEYMLNISEAEPDVEYRCDAEALEVTSYTYDPRVAGLTAFMTMRFEHDRPVEGRLLTLRLVPETAPIEPVLEYLRLPRDSANFKTNFRTIEQNLFENLFENLFRLRNIGLSTPRQALEWTRELRGSWWSDGEVAGSLTDITKQLEMVIEAEQVE